MPMKASKKKVAAKKTAKPTSKTAKTAAKTAKTKAASKPKAASRKAAAKTTKSATVKKKTAAQGAASSTPKKEPAKSPAKSKGAAKKGAKKKAVVATTAPAKQKGAVKKTAAKPKSSAKKNVTGPKSKQTTVVPARKKVATTRSAAPKTKAAKKKAAPAKSASPKQTAAPKKTAQKSPPKKKQPLPSILLEGDAPKATRSGPGSRYDLGPDAAIPHGGSGAEPGELPAAYGTGMLVATARDPHWLYVFWDLTDEQQNAHNRASADGHLILRLFTAGEAGRVTSETHVHPESRNWFVPVPHGGQRYSVALGYNDKQGKWNSVSESRQVATPPDSLADDTSADFATLPVEIPFEQLIATVRQVVAANVPLLEALEQLRAEGYDALPAPEYFKQSLREAGGIAGKEDLTPAQREALAEVVTMDEVRRVWIGSHEITELVKKQLLGELSSQAAAGGARGISSAGVASLSSPFGGAPAGPKDFWFNVNAELIIYGATEPDATVTIGGRKIQLRGDGTFSYRFALPDGQYDLPIQATNADGDDSRNADLAFSRDTRYRGEVGTHPQDERLRTPRPENTV